MSANKTNMSFIAYGLHTTKITTNPNKCKHDKQAAEPKSRSSKSLQTSGEHPSYSQMDGNCCSQTCLILQFVSFPTEKSEVLKRKRRAFYYLLKTVALCSAEPTQKRNWPSPRLFRAAIKVSNYVVIFQL